MKFGEDRKAIKEEAMKSYLDKEGLQDCEEHREFVSGRLTARMRSFYDYARAKQNNNKLNKREEKKLGKEKALMKNSFDQASRKSISNIAEDEDNSMLSSQERKYCLKGMINEFEENLFSERQKMYENEGLS